MAANSKKYVNPAGDAPAICVIRAPGALSAGPLISEHMFLRPLPQSSDRMVGVESLNAV